MNTIDEVGFLSPEIEGWIKRHRARHAGWFTLCEDLNKLAQHVMLSFNPPQRDRRLVVAATVFSRVVSHFQATILLTERGMLLEARAVARAALEATFIIRALLKDEKFIDDYAKDDAIRRKKTIKSLLKQSDNDLSEIGTARKDLETMLGKVENTISEEGIKELTVRKIATRGHMEPYYENQYALLCRTVHTRVRDLETGLIMDAEGWPDQFNWGPDPNPDAINEALIVTCDIMFVALKAVVELSGFPVDERFTTLWSTYEKLPSQLKVE